MSSPTPAASSTITRTCLAWNPWILSGSFVKAIPFEAGDTITASFTGFGDVSFHVA